MIIERRREKNSAQRHGKNIIKMFLFYSLMPEFRAGFLTRDFGGKTVTAERVEGIIKTQTPRMKFIFRNKKVGRASLFPRWENQSYFLCFPALAGLWSSAIYSSSDDLNSSANPLFA